MARGVPPPLELFLASSLRDPFFFLFLILWRHRSYLARAFGHFSPLLYVALSLRVLPLKIDSSMRSTSGAFISISGEWWPGKR
jgi:hypothetical protein